MIETISLCNTCYKKIPAFIYNKDGKAWIRKECDVHGKSEAIVDTSDHVSNFYRLGTMGNNNAIIIHVENGCNMKCSWCYYGKDKIYSMQFYDQLLRDMYFPHYSLMFSGGEPTIRPDYIELVEDAFMRGWKPSTITNMLKLADEEFFERTLTRAFIDSQSYRFALSFQHPKNYSKEEYKLKLKALDNISKKNLKASCVAFSIHDLDELNWIREFYDDTKHLYHMLRIRTMFHNWKNKGEKKLYLSDLHKAFLEKFSDYVPVQSNRIEQSNIYCLYMITNESRDISLASGPTVENIDYHMCSRPVHMLGPDLRCYPVPIAQIINQGLAEGWKDGYEVKQCLL